MSGKKKTRSTQTNTVTDFTRTGIETARNNARGILSANPFQTYGGERVAGLTDAQMAAQEQFGATQGQGADIMQRAAQAAEAAGGYRPEQVTAQSFDQSQLDRFMNPHLGAVRDANADCARGVWRLTLWRLAG